MTAGSGPTSQSPPGWSQVYPARTARHVVRHGVPPRRQPVPPPLGAEAFVGREGPGPQADGRVRITEKGRRAGEGVVGNPVEHHRARVEHRPAVVGGEQPGRLLGHLAVRDGQGGFEHALEGQQPVHIAGQVVEYRPVEGVHEGTSTVQIAVKYPQGRQPRRTQAWHLRPTRTPHTRPPPAWHLPVSPDCAAE